MSLRGLVQRQSEAHDLTDEQLLDEERKKREEIFAGIINIAKQMGGSLGLHLISGGVGLPLHLPVILWQVFQLLKKMKRRMKLRSVALKRDLKLKKIGLRSIAISTTIALVSPGLARLGAHGLNELIIDFHGGPIRSVSVKVPNILEGSGPIGGDQVQEIYLANTDSLPSGSFCLADQVRLCSEFKRPTQFGLIYSLVKTW